MAKKESESKKQTAARNTVGGNEFKNALEQQLARQMKEMMMHRGSVRKTGKEDEHIAKKNIGSLMMQDPDGSDPEDDIPMHKNKISSLPIEPGQLSIDHLEFNKPKMQRRVSKRAPVKF